MAITVEEEDPELFRETGVYECCVFCERKTKFWHTASNTPVCQSCGTIHSEDDLAAQSASGRGDELQAEMTVTQKAEAFDTIVAARKSYVEAVNAYNCRLELVKNERIRGNWRMNVNDEYKTMTAAQRHLDRVVQDLTDAALNSEAPD